MLAQYAHDLATMPEGFNRHVFWILTNHLGKQNAIDGPKIALELAPYYRTKKNLYDKVRTAVREMRNEGILICSNSNTDGAKGYYLAADLKEVHEFVTSEYTSRIESMSVTKNIMLRSAEKIFGKAYQEALW